MTLVVIRERAEGGYVATYHTHDGASAYNWKTLSDEISLEVEENGFRASGARLIESDGDRDGDVISVWQF